MSDDIVVELRIAVHRNGAMSVSGCIHEEAYAYQLLDAARDTIRRHNAKYKLNAGQDLVTPACDAPRKVASS